MSYYRLKIKQRPDSRWEYITRIEFTRDGTTVRKFSATYNPKDRKIKIYSVDEDRDDGFYDDANLLEDMAVGSDYIVEKEILIGTEWFDEAQYVKDVWFRQKIKIMASDEV